MIIKLTPPVDPIVHPVSQWFGTPKNTVTAQFYLELGLVGSDGKPMHNGIDFTCPIGTPVVACHDGTAQIGTSSDGALYIFIADTKKGLKTFYCHLNKFLIKDGEVVKEGQLIAESGNTGKFSTGAHLHSGLYLVDKNGTILNYNILKGAIDPAPYFSQDLKDGDLVKNESENKVFIMKNGYKWWIYDEETFANYMNYPINQASVKTIDLITYNDYKWGGIIGKK